ncbi:MAG: hypothetical protein GAK43_02446 [Stenotrophomonas maltophilia]|nr:MAG: hypothetical protein GAK43_02446 [Stenotrophomonas maltophilia]
MSRRLDFHVIELNGEFVASDGQPINVAQHHHLTLSRSALLKLMFSRDRIATGNPVPATQRSVVIAEAAETSAAQVPEAATVEALPETPAHIIEALQAEPRISPVEPALAEIEETLPNTTTELLALSTHVQPPNTGEPDADECRGDDERALESSEANEAAATQVDALPCNTSRVECTPANMAESRSTGAPANLIVRDSGSSIDNDLCDVHSTLDSLAGMAKHLSQQKLDTIRQREALDQHNELLAEKERTLEERSAALQALAESLEARERSSTRMAESLHQEKQRTEDLAETLRRRDEQLEERNAVLNRKEEELEEKLKQLESARERFRALVKSLNETAQLNDTSSTVASDAPIQDKAH